MRFTNGEGPFLSLILLFFFNVNVVAVFRLFIIFIQKMKDERNSTGLQCMENAFQFLKWLSLLQDRSG